MIALNFKLFFKCKVTLVATLIYLAIMCYQLLSIAPYCSISTDSFIECGRLTELSFLYFLIISYYIFSKAKHEKVEEVLLSIQKSRLSSYMSKGICLMIFNILICTLLLLYQLVLTMKTNSYTNIYIYFIFAGTLIHHFLLYFFAILLGRVISLVNSYAKGYLLLYLAYLTFGTVINAMLKGISVYAEWFYPISNLFSLYTQEYAQLSDYYYIFSMEPVNIQRLLFWIFLMALILSFRAKKPKIWLKRGIYISGAAINLALFLLPSASMNYDGCSSAGDSWCGNQVYYETVIDCMDMSKYKKANFKVLDYKLDFNIHRTLDAKVTMKVDTPNLQEYHFTLYHKYKIKKITNKSGTSLDYKQEGDYITVYLPEGETAEEFHFSYVAVGTTSYYSTSQGIFLPGYFAYYPMPGIRQMYVSQPEYYGSAIEGLGYKVSFHGKINTKVPLYSNLDIKEDGTFSGTTEGLTILGSYFAKEYNVDGCRILFPVLNEEIERPDTDMEYYQKFIKKYKDTEYDLTGKLIIIPPYMNGTFIYITDEYLMGDLGYLEDQYDLYIHDGSLYPIVDEETLEMIQQSQEMLQQMEEEQAEEEGEEQQ